MLTCILVVIVAMVVDGVRVENRMTPMAKVRMLASAKRMTNGL